MEKMAVGMGGMRSGTGVKEEKSRQPGLGRQKLGERIEPSDYHERK